MARTNTSSWLVDETVHGTIVVSIDETNDNTIVIQQDEDTPIWVAPQDIDALIDALRSAKIIAAGRG